MYIYRSDFLHIVKDLEQRAGHFNRRSTAAAAVAGSTNGTTVSNTSDNKPKPTALLPQVKVDAVGRLVVNDKTFTVGDAVEVYSVLSDETFLGFITVIDSEEVILKSESGPRFSFPIAVIKSGRYDIILFNFFCYFSDCVRTHLMPLLSYYL